MLDINLLTDFFKWLLILNITMMLLIHAILYFVFDFVYKFWKTVYMGSKEEFNNLIVKILLQYRIATFLFVFSPFLALLIINN